MINDLRDLLEELKKRGRLKEVKGAHWDLEIGTLNELMAEKKGPTLLFDEVVGYPKGFRVAANTLYQRLPQVLTFGFSEDASDVDVVRDFKESYKAYKPVPPVVVKDGPILENVDTGDNIDLFKFPVPKWHTLDGGRYIGTGVATITRDPDEGWVNAGTYRVMVQNKNTLAFYASHGKHAVVHREKYWAKGQDCPVVMVFGADPLWFGAATMPLPWGMSELDWMGYNRGKGIEVIIDEDTGLPVPATGEIVIAGFAPPQDVKAMDEGPFGEWQGYYASGHRNEPIINVKKVYYRNNPIILGQPPVKPPVNTFYPIPIHTASWLWNELEAGGNYGIEGVYVHGPGARIIGVISVKQRYPGHSMALASQAAALLGGGACTGRYIITVDEDIDPSNLDEVLWAVTTRVNPDTQIHMLPGFLTSKLDPMIPPERRSAGDFTTTKVIIDACRPYHWKSTFPPTNVAGKELREQTLAKWADLFKD